MPDLYRKNSGALAGLNSVISWGLGGNFSNMYC